jgi:CRP-like cAMP-binding protein
VNEHNYISQYDSFLLQQPSPANIDALEDTEVVNLSYADMQRLYVERPVFQIFGRKIAEMLFIMLTTQTTRLLTLPPEERYGVLVEQQPYVVQRVPQYMIASFIGITPEHLSRLRRKLSGRQIS